MDLKSTPNPIDDTGLAMPMVSDLFYRWGYNFYRDETQWHTDDLLIRKKLGDLLRQCRAHVAALEEECRRARLAQPTREHPFPDAIAVALVLALQHAQREIEGIETTFRALPMPDLDRVHQQHRNKHNALDAWVAVDAEMVLAVIQLHDAIVGLNASTIVAEEVAQVMRVDDIRSLWQRREQEIAVLTEGSSFSRE